MANTLTQVSCPPVVYEALLRNIVGDGVHVDYFTSSDRVKFSLEKPYANKFLELQAEFEGVPDLDSYLEVTARSLAIHLVFERSPQDAFDLFCKLGEPMASRVVYYLTLLRGVG